MITTQLCDSSMAFGQTYGAHSIKGEVIMRGEHSASFKPHNSWPPFSRFGAAIRPRVGVSGVTATAYFTNNAAAEEQAALIVENFKKQLNIVDVRKKFSDETVLYTGDEVREEIIYGEKKSYHTNGLEIKVAALDRSVYVTCDDIPTQMKHVEDVFRKPQQPSTESDIDRTKETLKVPLVTQPALLDGCLRPDFTGLPNRSGQAVASILISKNGVPLSASITLSSGSIKHDERVAAAALKCKYRPGAVDYSQQEVPYQFSYSWRENEVRLGPSKCMPPSYPKRALRHGEEGITLVKLRMDPATEKIEKLIARSSNFQQLDSAALNAVDICMVHKEAREDLKSGEWSVVPFNWVLQK